MVLVPFYSETRLAYERPLAGRQDVQRPSTTIHAKRKRTPIETELPGADSQPGLQSVAAAAPEKENGELSHICWV